MPTSITQHLDTFTAATSSPRDVLGLKKHSSAHTHGVKTECCLGSFSTKGTMCAYLSSFFLDLLLSSPLAGPYLHPQAFSFMSLFCCQGLK